MVLAIENSSAQAIKGSDGKKSMRLSFRELDGREGYKIAIQTAEDRSKSLLSRLTSWRWAATKIQAEDGSEKTVYVNIRSAAKRLHLSHAEVKKQCSEGKLLNWVKDHANEIKKVDSALLHVKFDMDQAYELIAFLDGQAKAHAGESLALAHPKTGLRFLYADSQFYVESSEMLGEGSFKTVVKAYKINTEESSNEFFALLKEDRKADAGESSKRERHFLEKLKDKTGFPKTLAIIEYGLEIFYLQPCYTNGELFDKINDRSLSDREKYNIAIKLLEALKEMHKMDIVHRDIKPENVLLDKDNNPVLTDFGFSIDLDPNTSAEYGWHKGGTRFYVSPQLWSSIIENQPSAPREDDIWAMGMALLRNSAQAA